MGISAIGERHDVTSIKHGIATLLVFLGVFFYLYGPPVTERFTRAANRECNHLTGDTYRSYHLEWETTWVTSIGPPHWLCHDLDHPERPAHDLGWWVGI